MMNRIIFTAAAQTPTKSIVDSIKKAADKWLNAPEEKKRDAKRELEASIQLFMIKQLVERTGGVNNALADMEATALASHIANIILH